MWHRHSCLCRSLAGFILRLPPHSHPTPRLAREAHLRDARGELECRRLDQRHRRDGDVGLETDEVDVAAEVVALPEGGEAGGSNGEAFAAVGCGGERIAFESGIEDAADEERVGLDGRAGAAEREVAALGE